MSITIMVSKNKTSNSLLLFRLTVPRLTLTSNNSSNNNNNSNNNKSPISQYEMSHVCLHSCYLRKLTLANINDLL